MTETILQNIRFVKRFVSSLEPISAGYPVIGSNMELAWLGAAYTPRPQYKR